ncbi:hypothetical protein GCM10027598_38870 [Amycolatopsis oliviviridis]|uniref:Uncharacterized protein n=1 Tax=Amycolatopsis oliviviridis TaxID=1471590 RepID=A0ABQ3LCK9_9PSEU|nr:hypothetical protein GCM10017790_22960 [Amycolatopsis oliviviridis]
MQGGPPRESVHVTDVLAWRRAALFLVYEAGPGWARRREPALTNHPEPESHRLGEFPRVGIPFERNQTRDVSLR